MGVAGSPAHGESALRASTAGSRRLQYIEPVRLVITPANHEPSAERSTSCAVISQVDVLRINCEYLDLPGFVRHHEPRTASQA